MAEREAWFEAWQAGDRAAGERLLRPHYRTVLRFFELNAGWVADDLTQRTFELCVRQAARVRDGGSLRAYLLGIARRQLAMHLRSMPRTLSFEEEQAGPQTRLSTLVARHRGQLLLLRVLAAMPKRAQVLLILRYWEQMSSVEIGRAHGVPPGTVRRQLADARAMLRKRLEMYERRLPTNVADDTELAVLLESLVAREK